MFQPLWTTLVKLDQFPNFRGEHKNLFETTYETNYQPQLVIQLLPQISPQAAAENAIAIGMRRRQQQGAAGFTRRGLNRGLCFSLVVFL